MESKFKKGDTIYDRKGNKVATVVDVNPVQYPERYVVKMNPNFKNEFGGTTEIQTVNIRGLDSYANKGDYRNFAEREATPEEQAAVEKKAVQYDPMKEMAEMVKRAGMELTEEEQKSLEG